VISEVPRRNDEHINPQGSIHRRHLPDSVIKFASSLHDETLSQQRKRATQPKLMAVLCCPRSQFNSQMSLTRWSSTATSAFVLVVTLTFDLLTSKFNRFIYVPNCIYVVNFF